MNHAIAQIKQTCRSLAVLAVIAVLPSLVGCSQLTVEVAVFNPEFKDSTPFLATDVAAKRQAAEAILKNKEIEKQARAASETYADAILTKVPAKVLPVDDERAKIRQELARLLYEKISPRTGTARAALQTAIDSAEAARLNDATDDAARRKAFVTAANSFIQANELVRSVPQLSDLDVKQAVKGVPALELAAKAVRPVASEDVAPEAVAAAKPAVQVTFDRIAPNNLFEDPMAPLFVGAPPEAWKAVYNKTHGFGSFGSTDIAIVMEEFGSFSVKGVRNNTSKVTEATFHSINLLSHLAAVSMGVPSTFKPLALGSQTGSSASAAPSSAEQDQLAKATADVAAANALLKRQRAAAVATLSSIVRERDVLVDTKDVEASTTARKGAVGRIKSAVDANAAELKASATPAAAPTP